MIMELNIPTELIHIIESYSRKIQPILLLEDIINYASTLKQLEQMYNKVIYTKYSDAWAEPCHTPIPWYSEFIKGLNIINANLQPFSRARAARLARLHWAKYSPEYRNKVYELLKRNLNLHLRRRPGDATCSPARL